MVTVKLIARLTDSSGSPIKGKPILFYYERDGTWLHIATAVTNEDGYAIVTYDVNQRTVFKAEFRGDDQYDPADAMAVWEPSGEQYAQPSRCQPMFRTGIDVLDRVMFCIGGRGITVAVVVAVFIVLLLLLRKR
jgi:hypothetical protein